jgi:hypothetical protein
MNTPTVWILWSGIEENRRIVQIFADRDAACAELCRRALSPHPHDELTHPKIERQTISGTNPVLSDGGAGAVHDVVRAYRGLASAGKTDMARASLRPLALALTALAYPMAVPENGS